tara:strand:+ start:1892 stop:2272 length:381 start_codon:yes stop_codon:yes gene_type:complete
MKATFFKLPEYYLIMLAVLAGYSPPFNLNLISIGLVGIFILQIIFKNRISGIALGTLFFLANLYFLGALLSEFNEFTEFNNQAKQLLTFGLTIWIVNILISLTMIYKYASNNFKTDSQIELDNQAI